MMANPWVRLINNWLHDVGTGLWAACVLVIWVLQNQKDALAESGLEVIAALYQVQWLMFALLLGALAVIALTGVLRLLYWRAETPAEEMPAKRPALIGKHIAFLVIYGGGTVWTYLMFTPNLA